MKTLFALVATSALAVVACGTPPGGPEYADLGLRTVDAGGAEKSRHCVALPVLPGAVLERALTLAPGLSAEVHTEPDFAEVALGGTDDPESSHVTLSKETLLRHYAGTLAVTTTTGVAYNVVLSSPCAPVDAGAD
jgi:hypothetical protein